MKINKSYVIYIFLILLLIISFNNKVISKNKPTVSGVSMYPLADKNSWFATKQKAFTPNDKGVYIELNFLYLESKTYDFGIKAYRPDGSVDKYNITKTIKPSELEEGGHIKWYWQYDFEKDNLFKYPGKWKVEFLLDGKKKGKKNFIINYRHEVLNKERKSINYYYKINLDIWLKEDLQKLSMESLILFAKYISNNYLNYSDEKIIETNFYNTKEKSKKNLMFTYKKDKIKGIHRIIWNKNNKNLTFSEEKITKLKPHLNDNRTNVNYEIISKENLNYGRYQYHVVVKEKVSVKELKKLARDITEKAKTENDFSALTIWFYDYEEYFLVGLTLGKANFAKNGKWENAMSTKAGNYEEMSYSYKLRKKNWDKQLTPKEVKIWYAWQKAMKKANDKALEKGTELACEEEITKKISNQFNISKKKVNDILFKQIDWASIDLNN